MGWGQTYFDMSTSNYSEDFSSISTWANNYTSGNGAQYWEVATGTVFSTSTSGGVQKGTQSMIFLATGTTTTTTDLLINFSGRNAGTFSLDWEKVVNPIAGTRDGTLKIQYSIDGGGTFSDLTDYTQPEYNNSNTPQSGSISINLPNDIDNVNQVVFRFHVTRKTTGGSGNNPKVQIDNIIITSSEISTCTKPETPNGDISGTTPECNTTTLTYTHGTNQPEDDIDYYWQTSATGLIQPI